MRDWHTILEYRGSIKLDHDLIRIFIFLHITHIAQVLGWHQQRVFAISFWGSGSMGRQSGSRRKRCRRLLLHWDSQRPSERREQDERKREKSYHEEGGQLKGNLELRGTVYGVKLKVAFRVFGSHSGAYIKHCKHVARLHASCFLPLKLPIDDSLLKNSNKFTVG